MVLPFEAALPGNVYFGFTTRLDAVRNDEGSGYHAEFVNSVAFGHDLIGRLFGYLEFFTWVSTQRDAEWVGTLNVGLVYGLTRNIELYSGVDLGVTRSADDWSPFVGLAWRF